MKKILAGIIIILGLSFTSLGNIGFAQCNPECPEGLICCTKGASSACTSPNSCNSAGGNNTSNGDNFVGPPTPADIKAKQDCEKQEQMVWQNGSCVNDINGDKKATCLLFCKNSTNDTKFCDCKCNGGIVLNTNIPFIGSGRCITKDGNTADGDSAITGISSALTQIFMTLIITGGFAMIIRGGAQIAMGQTKEGKDKIINVIIAFAALGSLGIILRLINPNFFK